jgi:hypothetical protein
MKILLIGIPRSGTTTLMDSIGSSLKLYIKNEPFNEASNKASNKDVNWDYTPENNVIVKSLMGINVNNPIEFYKNYSRLFDKTILLSRKNTQEAVESYSFQALQTRDIPFSWNEEKYTYTQTDDSRIIQYRNWMISMKNNLESLSKELNIEIDWYEDLYSGKKEEIVRFVNKHKIDINLDKFSEYLNPKHRLRQFDKTIKNII